MAAANKNRTQRSIDGLSHNDCIDLVVRKGTLVVGVEEVATSWRRCLTAHHLDPEMQAAPHIITEKEIKDSREPLLNVILHAQEELDRLYAIVGPQQYVVLLCDRDGVAIHHRGDESMADTYKDCGIWLGGVWSERIEGTNGIGTCINDQRPTMVHRGQHFRTRHSNLSCVGAPISDPLGRLAAVLDTSSMNPQTTEQSLSLVMGVTKVCARGIEERIFREYFRHAWNIAAAPCGDSDVAVLVAVDNDQRILGADQIARRIFSLNDEVLNREMALATIFEYDSSIFRLRLRSGFCRYFGRIACSGSGIAQGIPGRQTARRCSPWPTANARWLLPHAASGEARRLARTPRRDSGGSGTAGGARRQGRQRREWSADQRNGAR